MVNNFDDFLRFGGEFLPGNSQQLRLSLIALLLNRNVLIEDVPGMGKTTLVKFLARATGLDFRRIQFTSDLLPSDILGVSIFNRETEKFLWKPGPIFGELILADELNRGTPKTQSALLQAMEEKHVTVDGTTWALPERFCLFATQNPRGQFGTYPLPESQLDRFLFKFSMGHLNQSQEMELLAQGSMALRLDEVRPVVTREKLTAWERDLKNVKASKFLLEYVTQLLALTRGRENHWGLSPRAGLDLLDGARGYAFLEGRDHVLPDDVRAIFPFVAGHRMFSGQLLSAQDERERSAELLAELPLMKGAI